MNIFDDATIKEQYKIDQQIKTLHLGKLLSMGGIPVISAVSLSEWLLLHNFSYFLCRLLFIVPMTVFLVLSYSIFKKNLKLVVPFHAITISGGLLMMTAHTVVQFDSGDFIPAVVFPTASGGLVVVFFTAFLFAAGARRYLKYILTLPILILLFYTVRRYGLILEDAAYFINPILATAVVSVFTQYQEKLTFNEFRQRKLAEAREKMLQHEIEEKQKLEDKLYEKSIKDELTGAYNRRMLFAFLEEQIGLAGTKKEVFAICYVDIDNLKTFNDLYGHLEGDSLLHNFILLLKKNIREEDIICRVGGDEFIVIFPKCHEAETQNIIKRARGEITATLVKNGMSVTFSHGFAEYRPDTNLTANDLIERADRAMYEMKKAEKGRERGKLSCN